jgi:Fibronectin type III domain
MHIRLAQLLTAVLAVSLSACGGDDSPAAPIAIAPGAPTGVSASISDGSVSLAFTPPTSDGGAAITSYLATCTAAGVAVTGTSASSPVSVTGLTNGSEYACVVAASNTVGLGVASETVMVTPMAAQ